MYVFDRPATYFGRSYDAVGLRQYGRGERGFDIALFLRGNQVFAKCFDTHEDALKFGERRKKALYKLALKLSDSTGGGPGSLP